MSNVVALKPDQRGRAIADQGGERGRILLFTGVRYFREEPEGELQGEADLVLAEAGLDDADPIERLKA